ncbi:conserved hypothetical protein [Talaromyces stipitatus ATCC 10500]|uniref:AB hydrolase-1 domain-containing protein n=1 Tax=Talaromyces stipitatus (strain ATCC 10500 / CBS 375.48 / QM 6759 / NRRL 1006) TaxID=441959 RepID=B8MMX1_TALSN|nr:uncharacterized protein TSTA_101600 [Talaromyces stipitatus ATCC 10500]EED13920.1 conserved hypothetical protein [Talaromyces stipitatus ATCC 10500]
MILKLTLLISMLPTVFAGKPCCFDFGLPFHVSLPVPQLNVTEFGSSYDSTVFLTASVTRNANLSLLALGQTEINRDFDIHFRYCEPENVDHKNGVLQILSQGVGFDKSYWSFGSEEYNYIASATKAGYATLSDDRLGVGYSEKADPSSEIQVILVRKGQLLDRIPVPKKLVHIGHSFGSLITNGLAATQPSLSAGIVLIGFTHNTSWVTLFELFLGFEVARPSNPARFHGYNSGYLTWGNEYDNRCAFFTLPFFDPAILLHAEALKAPFAISELLSFTSVPLAAGNFTGPVHVRKGMDECLYCQ